VLITADAGSMMLPSLNSNHT